MVRKYFDIRIFSAPAVFLQYALMGWFFGMQNALIPLFMTLIINIANIAFSYYFVNHLHLGIEGAAYGTVIGQYLGVIFGFIMLLRLKYILIHVNIKNTFLKDKLLRFFMVNRDIFIRTLALTFSLAFLFSQAAKESQDTLAIMVLLLQFMIWMSFAIDGFANATESLVGKYYGAKDWTNFNKSIRYNFYWGALSALLFSLAYFFLGRTFLELYTNQTHIINQAMPYMWLVSMLPLLSFAAFIWDGVFIGMTASKSMRDAVLLSTLLFVGIFYLTKGIDYSWALWGSFVLFFVFRGGIQSWMFWKKGRGLK
jgi:MATE family multidrug resistance protein